MFITESVFGFSDNFHTDHVRIGCWVITGMLMFLILEKTFGDENEFDTVSNIHYLSYTINCHYTLLIIVLGGFKNIYCYGDLEW